jgi:hypothetical protein
MPSPDGGVHTLAELEALLHARYAGVAIRDSPANSRGWQPPAAPVESALRLMRGLSTPRRPFLGDDASLQLSEGPREGLLVSFGWGPDDAGLL